MTMDIFNLKTDLKVFGKQVKSFPKGIKETFDELIAMVPDGMQRSHFGLSYMTPEGKIIYYAASQEKEEGEAEKLNCERFIIEKGEYLTITIKHWMKKTGSIKNVFEEMMKDDRIDKTKWAVEWYKSDDEMLCMLRTTSTNK